MIVYPATSSKPPFWGGESSAQLRQASSGELCQARPVSTGEHAGTAKQRAIEHYDTTLRAYFGRGPEVIAAWDRLKELL